MSTYDCSQIQGEMFNFLFNILWLVSLTIYRDKYQYDEIELFQLYRILPENSFYKYFKHRHFQQYSLEINCCLSFIMKNQDPTGRSLLNCLMHIVYQVY